MKWTLWIWALCLLVIPAHGQVLGDINQDGKVGLEEAVYALQVTSGSRVPSSVPTYDYAEYDKIPNSSYLYEIQEGAARYTGYVTASEGTFKGQPVIVETHGAGTFGFDGFGTYVIYYSVDDKVISDVGSFLQSTERQTTPPRIFGGRHMRVGDRWPNFYKETEFGLWLFAEHEFVGLEDVIVPAGTFKDCIKILQRRSGGSYRMSYYAKGVGLVRYIQADGPTTAGREWVLVRAEVDGINFPGTSSSICRIGGTWMEEGMQEFPDASIGQFYFSTEVLPVHLQLRLLPASATRRFYLKSTDGINFVSDMEYYSNQTNILYPPETSITIENGNFNGYIQTFNNWWEKEPSDKYLIQGVVTCD